jgi:hypothetical protein
MIRKTIILLFLAFLSLPLYSQIYIDGKLLEPANENTYYLAVRPAFRIGGVELLAQTALTRRQNTRDWLTDASGNRLQFNNWVAALDYLYGAGWETVSAAYFNDEYDTIWYLLKPR